MSSRSMIRRSVARVQRRVDGAHRGDAAPGEHHAANEVLVSLRSFETAIVDDDGLQDRQPVVGEQVGACRHELVVVTPIDGLDHLDGDQLVEPTPQVTPVVAQHRHTIGQTGFGYPLGHEGPLGLGDGGGGHPASVALGCVQGESTPTRPDLDHTVVGPQVKLGAEPVDLGLLGFTQSGTRGARTPRRSRSWSRRASARRNRWTGRSAPARCGGRRLYRVPSGAPARRAPCWRCGPGRPTGCAGNACRRNRIWTKVVRSSASHHPAT